MKDIIIRNGVWLALGLIAVLALKPVLAELNTLWLVLLFESLALALSGLALFAYSKIKFTQQSESINIGIIFLGVHICVGLVVIGVYIAQM